MSAGDRGAAVLQLCEPGDAEGEGPREGEREREGAGEEGDGGRRASRATGARIESANECQLRRAG